MLKERLSVCTAYSNRHVPPHKAHRIGRTLLAILGLWILAPVALGDLKFTTVIRETDLRKEAKVDAESLGLLPRGSVIQVSGPKEGKFYAVKVELNDGVLEGWVDVSALKKKKKPKSEEAAATEGAEEGAPEKKVLKPKRKVFIPRDEEVLLRREPTFGYGALFGIHSSSIDVELLPEDGFSGTGITIGGHLSYVIDPTFRLRFEGAYTTHNGSNAAGDELGFNFMEFAVVGEILFRPAFVLFGGIHYAFGLGIANLPLTIALDNASELSGLGVQIGAGYRFALSDISSLTPKLRYMGSLSSSPMKFQSFGIVVNFEIQG